MHATGIQPLVVQVAGMLQPAGVSLALGGKVLVHPSAKVAIEKDVLNCDPPRICAAAGVNCAVLCDSCFTPATPRLTPARAASIPLVWVAFALAPPTAGCMKYARIVVSAAQSRSGPAAQSARNAG